MFNKQINGVKFREVKNHKVEITNSPFVGPGVKTIEDYNDAMDLYKMLYAEKYADKVFDNVLKDLCLNFNTAHLLSEDDIIKKDGKVLSRYYAGIKRNVTAPESVFIEYMENALRKQGIDLSYMSALSSKYGIELQGNAGAMAWQYKYLLFDNQWQDFETTPQELYNYLKTHKNIRVMQSSHYGNKVINKEVLLKTKFGTTSQNRGIGSQSSVALTSVKLKTDKFGNLLLKESLEIWD